MGVNNSPVGYCPPQGLCKPLIFPAPYIPNIQRWCRDDLRGIQTVSPTDCSDLNFSLRCPQSWGRCLNLFPSWQDEEEKIHNQSWKLWLLLSFSLLLSTLQSETSFLLEKWEAMHRNSPRCAEFWDLQINSHPNSWTDGWLYPAFTTCLMDRRAGWWLCGVVLPLKVAGELHLAMLEEKFSCKKYYSLCADLQKILPICTDLFF